MTIAIQGRGANSLGIAGRGVQGANGYSVDSFGTNGYGFDKDLVLYLPLHSLPTSPMASSDIYRHICTVTGATWGSQGRTFDGDDYISVPHNSAYTLTTGEITLLVWAYPTLLTGSTRDLVVKGIDDTSGYQFSIGANGIVSLATNQVAANQLTRSAVGSVAINNWYFLGTTRSGAVVKIFQQGLDVTSVSASHIDPVNNTGSLIFGTEQDLTSRPFVGIESEVLIYNRALSAAEIQQNYQATKWRYS